MFWKENINQDERNVTMKDNIKKQVLKERRNLVKHPAATYFVQGTTTFPAFVPTSQRVGTKARLVKKGERRHGGINYQTPLRKLTEIQKQKNIKKVA